VSEADTPRKASQEVEVDRLLAEEFACDPGFVERFLAACALPVAGMRVETVAAEPSLGGEGYGDLLILGRTGDDRVALLIEDKVMAAPGIRQADRYASHAARMRADGWAAVWTVLVAPAAYRGERDRYDASVDLEHVAELLDNPDPARLAFRRAILLRAVDRARSSGVQVPDVAVHAFKAKHLDHLAKLGRSLGMQLHLPTLKAAYYDGDSWIENIREASLPQDARLRHRCWMTARRSQGSVDLILLRPCEDTRSLLAGLAPDGARVAAFSKGKGWQISLPVPEMRPRPDYDSQTAEIVADALQTLCRLARHIPPMP
jgi:hypothetical protein